MPERIGWLTGVLADPGRIELLALGSGRGTKHGLFAAARDETLDTLLEEADPQGGPPELGLEHILTGPVESGRGRGNTGEPGRSVKERLGTAARRRAAGARAAFRVLEHR
ncbi:hypothetical protein [Streptomyces albogriseolus]|uniref:hypothetical protein n=1 Tax=Streptomyces albogriseolus TaxID=1887 RepID=UPI00345F5088